MDKQEKKLSKESAKNTGRIAFGIIISIVLILLTWLVVPSFFSKTSTKPAETVKTPSIQPETPQQNQIGISIPNLEREVMEKAQPPEPIVPLSVLFLVFVIFMVLKNLPTVRESFAVKTDQKKDEKPDSKEAITKTAPPQPVKKEEPVATPANKGGKYGKR